MIADEDARSTMGDQGPWASPLLARVGQLVTALALTAAGLFFVWQSAFLPFGGFALPGPGFFPFVLGIAIAVLALAVLLRAWSEAGDGEVVYVGHRDILVVVGALVGVAFAFERLGAHATLGLFMFCLLLLVARTSLWRALAGAGLGVIAVWVFFNLLLGVQLPRGQF